MRTIIVILALALCDSLVAVSPAPDASGIGQFDGYTYEVRRDFERSARSEWAAEKVDIPVSPPSAIAKGRAGLKAVVGAAHEHFFCSAVRLERPGGLTNLWLYLVEFQSAHDSLIIRGPNQRQMWPKLHFIVYLSGEIEIPTKQKPVVWP